MTDLTAARAVAILRDTPCVALPLTDLARRLDYGDPDALARRLGPDPRLRILDPAGFPELDGLAPERAAAYDRALRAAGLRAARRVALIDPPASPPGAGIGALLRSTTVRLLAPGTGAEHLYAAAERANRILQATLPDSSGPPTTRPPGLRPSSADPPTRQPDGTPGLPRPGSHRQ